jgi:putative Holliday junction resolvase
MRILALDHGDRRIGVAVSDPLEIAAHGLPNIEADGTGAALEQIRALVEQKEVEMVVVGLPINMNGSEGPRARKARGFAKRLRRALEVPVEMMDERLTTARAHRALSREGVSMRERGERVDRMAAQEILRRYMNRKKTREDEE